MFVNLKNEKCGGFLAVFIIALFALASALGDLIASEAQAATADPAVEIQTPLVVGAEELVDNLTVAPGEKGEVDSSANREDLLVAKGRNPVRIFRDNKKNQPPNFFRVRSAEERLLDTRVAIIKAENQLARAETMAREAKSSQRPHSEFVRRVHDLAERARENALIAMQSEYELAATRTLDIKELLGGLRDSGIAIPSETMEALSWFATSSARTQSDAARSIAHARNILNWAKRNTAHKQLEDSPSPPYECVPAADKPCKTEEFLGEELSASASDKNGWTHLHWAAAYNDAEAARRLLEMGADPNSSDIGDDSEFKGEELQRLEHLGVIWGWFNTGDTPLAVAASFNSSAVAALLIDKGANIHAKDTDGWTPLHVAASENAPEVVSLLIKSGADIHAKSNNGGAPLHYAARNNSLKAVSLLLENGADIHAKATTGGDTPLHYAAYGNALKVASLLIDKGADIHVKATTGGDTPLHSAAFGNAFNVALLLINKGADANAKNQYGWPPLHRAAESNSSDVAALLLENGAEGDTKGIIFEWTPLHMAARKNSPEVADLLLENGADIHAKNKQGWMPLHYAAYNNAFDMAVLLLENGADVNAKNNNGNPPLHIAMLENAWEVVVLLLTREAHVNAKGSDGATPLHWAAENGMDRIVALLLDRGADINAEDNQGETPLDRANKKGHNAVASLLQGRGGISAIARRERERQEAEARRAAARQAEAQRKAEAQRAAARQAEARRKAEAQRAAAAERARQASSSDSGGGLLRGALGLGLGALAGKGLYDQTGDAEAAGRLAGEVMTGVMGLDSDSGGGSASTGGGGLTAEQAACQLSDADNAEAAALRRAAETLGGVSDSCCHKAVMLDGLHRISVRCRLPEKDSLARQRAQALDCARKSTVGGNATIASCRSRLKVFFKPGN